MSEEGTSLKINSTKPGRISGSFGRISRPWKSVWVPFLALGRFSIIIPRRDHSSTRQLGQIFVCLIVSIFAFIRFMKKLAILFKNSLMRNVKRASIQQTFFIRSSTRRINLFSHFQISTIIQSLSLLPYFRYFFSLRSEQAVSVCNSTVSINLTITARWIRQNRHVLRRGSQFVLVSRSSEYVCTLGRARARISTWIAMNMRLREEK